MNIILHTPSKPGVLPRNTFFHTPGEARSVGLAKACVFPKIYFYREIRFKNIIKTEWEIYMSSYICLILGSHALSYMYVCRPTCISLYMYVYMLTDKHEYVLHGKL